MIREGRRDESQMGPANERNGKGIQEKGGKGIKMRRGYRVGIRNVKY